MAEIHSPQIFDAAPGRGGFRPPLALEALASVFFTWIGLWTALWLLAPTQGVSNGSWFGFFGSPLAMGIFALAAVPVGLYLCASDKIRLRPLMWIGMALELGRFVRSGFGAK